MMFLYYNNQRATDHAPPDWVVESVVVVAF